MSQQELDAIIAVLEANPLPDVGDLAALRAKLAEPQPLLPVPDNIEVRQIDERHVKGEWQTFDGADAGIILYFHGGAYCVMSAATHRHVTAALALEARAKVFSVDYRLAPEHPFPAAIEDAMAAYNWLLALGTPPEKIVMAGDSAGAGLVMATLVTLRDRAEPLPAAAICLSPWVDLSMSKETIDRYIDDPMVDPGLIEQAIKHYLQGADGWNPLASPLFADLGNLPPLYILAGKAEFFCGEAELLAAKASEDGTDTKLDAWDHMFHDWPFFHPILSEGRDAITRMADFAREKLAREIS